VRGILIWIRSINWSMRTRPNWTRPLPRPVTVPVVINLTTLADVRALIDRHLPAHTHNDATWRYVREKLAEAARGGDTMDVAEVALHLEGVECRPK
jgi:hypothetical protein